MKKYLEKRPWGKFEQYTHNEVSTVKILTVNPKQMLSLQKHKKRKEFWRLLDNSAKITVGKKTFRAKKDDEIIIPKETLHRIEAYSKPVHIMEIAFGRFDENDIKRFDDIYNRE